MANRDFYINQESLVKVKGGAHTSLLLSGNISASTELGLSSEQIKVTVSYYHKDLHVDDYGPDVPADVITHLAKAQIRLPLVHYDPLILDTCLAESMGGSVGGAFAGTLPPMGTPLGGWLSGFASGNHYISLNIIPGGQPQTGLNPWRFPFCYMTGPPYEIPLGVNASITMTNWLAIPYGPPSLVALTKPILNTITSPGGTITTSQGFLLAGIGNEMVSSGKILWDHGIDT